MKKRKGEKSGENKKKKQKEKKETCYEPKKLPKVAEQKDEVARSHKLKYRILWRKFRAALQKIQTYKTALDTERKKLYRQKKTHDKEMMTLKAENDKLRARQEIMEISLREVYADCKTPGEKQIIKEVPLKMEQKTNTVMDPTLLGLKGRIRVSKKRLRRPLHGKIMTEITTFFNRDDVSRSTAGKKETRTRNNHKMQIRYLVDTLKNLYQIYKDEGGKYSYATFFRYKPFYVLSPNASSRDTCMCIKHANMELKFEALKKNGVISHPNISDLLKNIVCDTKSYECMYNKCEKCANARVTYSEDKFQEEVIWRQWVREDHKYNKNDGEHTTKKTFKKETKGLVSDLVADFEKQLNLFKIHNFNWGEQYRQYRACITDLKEDEIVILCDFSENYDTKYGKEVQQRHYGGSQQSVTLHTGVIFFNKYCQSFVTMSDDNCHEPHAIWAHILPIIKLAKEMNPNLRVVHYFSDGPSSQYRQKKNFFLLNFFTEKLKLSYSTWSFSEAGHGKSLADGIGGTVKRQLDRRVFYGEDVLNANDAHRILQRTMTTVKSFIISPDDIKNMKKLVPEGIRAVPGTMKLHQIITTEPNEIKYRQLSCFCGKMRGLCSCHGPKTHRLVPDEMMKELFSAELPASMTEPSIQLTENSSTSLASDPLLGQFTAPDSFEQLIAQIDISLRDPEIATEQFESPFDGPIQLEDVCFPLETTEQFESTFDFKIHPEDICLPLENSVIIGDVTNPENDSFDTHKLSLASAPVKQGKTVKPTDLLPPRIEKRVLTLKPTDLLPPPIKKRVKTLRPQKVISHSEDNSLDMSSPKASKKIISFPVNSPPVFISHPEVTQRVIGNPEDGLQDISTLKGISGVSPTRKVSPHVILSHRNTLQVNTSTQKISSQAILPPKLTSQVTQPHKVSLLAITPTPEVSPLVVPLSKVTSHVTPPSKVVPNIISPSKVSQQVFPFSDVTPEVKVSPKVDPSHNYNTLKRNISLRHELSMPPAKQGRTLQSLNSISKRRVSSTRTLPCHLCKTRQPFILHQMIQCMVCKNWVCSSCSGTRFLEYVCDICLEV